MDIEKPPIYHEIFRPVSEAIQMTWETLGKFVAKFHYHQEQLPPPDPDRPIGPNY